MILINFEFNIKKAITMKLIDCKLVNSTICSNLYTVCITVINSKLL